MLNTTAFMRLTTRNAFSIDSPFNDIIMIIIITYKKGETKKIRMISEKRVFFELQLEFIKKKLK